MDVSTKRGVSVHVSNAAPKADQNRNNVNQNHPNFNYSPGNSNNSIVHSLHQSVSGGSSGGRHSHARGNNGNSILGGLNNSGNVGGHHSGPMGVGSGMVGYGMNSGGGVMGGLSNGSSGMMGNSFSLNRQDGSIAPYNRGSGSVGNYLQQNPNPHNNSGSAWNNQQNRGNLDMPNLQALGINPQGQNHANQGQNANNPLGVGLNLNSLPMNPAIVAAALNQWSLLGNQLQNQSQDQQGSHQAGSFLSWMAQGGNSSGNGNSGGILGNGNVSNSSTSASGGNQGSSSTPCNDLQQSGGGNQGWSRQSNGSITQGSGEKNNFI